MPLVNGAEVRARRQRLGVKLGKFARQAGVGYKTLANIESGHQRHVSIEVINLIAAELGEETTADDLLAGPKGVAA